MAHKEDIKIKMKMNILVSFNENYMFPTKVMLKSLIVNNDADLNIYVILNDLSDETIESFKCLEAENVHFNFIQISFSELNNLPINRYFTKETYIRLFAQNYLSDEIERILWLDGDIIINKSIVDFYNQSFDGKCYIAVRDHWVIHNREEVENRNIKLGLKPETDYVNAGVLLINLKKVREEIMDNLVLDYARLNIDKLSFLDQDILNGFLHSYIKVMEDGFNYNYFAYMITMWNKRRVLESAYIIHYACYGKPWNKWYRRYGFGLWWKYALMLGAEYRILYLPVLLTSIIGKLEQMISDMLKKLFPSLHHGLVKKYLVVRKH